MTIDDIMLEQQLDKVRRLDAAWLRFEAEARELDRGSGLRGAIAGALARASIWVDRRAGERVLTPTVR